MTRAQRPRIAVAQPVLRGNEKRYVNECLDTNWISSIGPFISRFEEGFASFCGVKHAIACANGTVALHAALLAHGVGPGDEVLIPTLTFIATANAVKYCGATPVFVDSEPTTWCMDPADLARKVTPRTRGIVPVHLYGHPADMDPILEVARRHGLFVSEDAAEAHGATYKGRAVGGLADSAVFSFFGNKIITTGEGGMVVTNDDAFAGLVRQLKGQGMDPARRYWFPMVGYNYRMTNIQAAIGLAQLEVVEEQLAARRRVAEWYDSRLRGLADRLEVQPRAPWARHVHWMYSAILSGSARIERDALLKALDADGIETRPIFYPMHVLPPYLDPARPALPVAERLAARGLNLPTHGALREEDVDYVCERLRHHVTRAA
jgi:perosamine synthetase